MKISSHPMPKKKSTKWLKDVKLHTIIGHFQVTSLIMAVKMLIQKSHCWMHEFTFHFQVEKLVKALKDYYNSQGHSNTNTQSTGGGDTSQVKYFSICISTSTDTVTFYTNTFNSGTSAESEKLQTFFFFYKRGVGGISHFLQIYFKFNWNLRPGTVHPSFETTVVWFLLLILVILTVILFI